jgi:hypothetical protein
MVLALSLMTNLQQMEILDLMQIIKVEEQVQLGFLMLFQLAMSLL